VAPEALSAFFSYSRADSEFALKLAEDLKGAGANVWMDQLDIEPGTPWDRAVEDALTRSPLTLVILSPVAVGSDNVSDEVSFALSKQKRLIPVLYRECEVPFRLARLQHIDFRADYARGLKALLKALGTEQRAISSAAVPVPAPANPRAVAERRAAQTAAEHQARERAAVTEQTALNAQPKIQASATAADNNTQYYLMLADVGHDKMAVLGAIRELTGLDLKQAKQLMREDFILRQTTSTDEVSLLKKKFEAIGAKIDVKSFPVHRK
jgi:ribosomal protein L7/L12